MIRFENSRCVPKSDIHNGRNGGYMNVKNVSVKNQRHVAFRCTPPLPIVTGGQTPPPGRMSPDSLGGDIFPPPLTDSCGWQLPGGVWVKGPGARGPQPHPWPSPMAIGHGPGSVSGEGQCPRARGDAGRRRREEDDRHSMRRWGGAMRAGKSGGGAWGLACLRAIFLGGWLF